MSLSVRIRVLICHRSTQAMTTIFECGFLFFWADTAVPSKRTEVTLTMGYVMLYWLHGAHHAPFDIVIGTNTAPHNHDNHSRPCRRHHPPPSSSPLCRHGCVLNQVCVETSAPASAAASASWVALSLFITYPDLSSLGGALLMVMDMARSTSGSFVVSHSILCSQHMLSDPCP